MCPFDDNNNKEIHIILILLFLNNPNTHSNKFHISQKFTRVISLLSSFFSLKQKYFLAREITDAIQQIFNKKCLYTEASVFSHSIPLSGLDFPEATPVSVRGFADSLKFNF